MKANDEQAKYDKALREKIVNYFSLGEFNILCHDLDHRLQVKGLRQLSRAMIQTQMPRFFVFV